VLLDPMVAIVHLIRLVLLGVVLRAKWKADEHWEVVETDEGAEAAAAVPAIIQGYYTGAASIRNKPENQYVQPAHADREIENPEQWELLGEDPTPTVRQIDRPLHITASAQ
jgi:hypothetical protein